MRQAISRVIVIGALAAMPGVSSAFMEDDPLLAKLQISEFEARAADSLTWDIEAWIGKDLNKLWLRSEGERAGGVLGEAELQLLYSRAVAPFWDLQIGWRRDWQPGPERNWLALGFEGLAPYFIKVDAAVFIGDHNLANLRLDVRRELLFTQKVILKPGIELNFHSRNHRGTGSGLSEVEIGLRLHYAINRQLLPYVGVNWQKKIGSTADYAHDEGEDSDDVQWLVGLSAWF